MSDRPPSGIAEAPDKDHTESPCDCPEGPNPQETPDGEIFCKKCKVVLGRNDPVEAVGLPPDVLKHYHRMKMQLEKLRNHVTSLQSFKCVGTEKKGKGCGNPVFWGGRGPAPKWCPDCLRKLNREKLKKWRHQKPEAWEEIRRRSAKKTSERKKDAYRRGITEVSRREVR